TGPPKEVSPSRKNTPRTSSELPLGRRSAAGMSSRVAIDVVSSRAEQPLDIGELELHVSRPAVIALAGIGCRLHFAQQRVHLLAFEAAARAHRAVAGHGRRDVHEAALEWQRLVPLRHVLGE